MPVIQRLAHNRQELTVEEEADLVQMERAACVLRELSKPEERSQPRSNLERAGGEAAEAKDKETHANEATKTEDSNVKRNQRERTTTKW